MLFSSTDMTPPATATTAPGQVPSPPPFPAELLRVARQPLVRVDYTARETRHWREGSWLPFAGTKFSAEREVAFAHRFQAVESDYQRGTGPWGKFASRDFDAAVTIGSQLVQSMNSGDGYKPRYAAAVLQATDGAYYAVAIPETTGMFDRQSDLRAFMEINSVKPKVDSLDQRATSPWSQPTSSTATARSRRPPSDRDRVDADDVTNVAVDRYTRYTPSLQAIIDVDHAVHDLRTTAVAER